MSDITLNSLTLPYDLMWQDEFLWTGVVSNKRFSIGGVIQIETSSFQANSGRPITLTSEEAWITREDLLTLLEMASDPDLSMLLTLQDGRTFTVKFRHWEDAPIEAVPVKAVADPQSTDYYRLSLKLISVL